MTRKLFTAAWLLAWAWLPVWHSAAGQGPPPPPLELFEGAPQIPGGPDVPDAKIGEPAPIPEAATRDATAADTENDVEDDADIRTEIVRERYPNRKIKVERHVAQDAARNYANHGLWTMWSPDGTMIAQGRFEWGKRQGEWTRLYVHVKDEAGIAGKLTKHFATPFAGIAHFKDHKLHGTWRIVDAKQRDVKSWEFKDGRLHGKAIAWYPNGQKMSEATFENGALSDEFVEWDSDGNIMNKTVYRDGRSTTPYVKKFPSGEKQFEGQYLGPRKIFKTTVDFWNGFVELEVVRKEGQLKRHGEWIEWHKNGGKKFEGAFKGNNPVGRHTWWFSNGQKKAEGTFRDGKEHGRWVWWHDTGLKRMEGHFVDGVESGTWVHWKPNGKVEEVQEHSVSTAPRPPTATADSRHRNVPRVEHPPVPSVRTSPGRGSTRRAAPLRRR